MNVGRPPTWATSSRPPSIESVEQYVRAGPPTGSRFQELLTAPIATRAPPGPVPRAGPPPPSAASPLRALLEGALRADREVEEVLAAARRGKTFSPAELLEVQITVFRCAQTVEILSRAVDKLVGAVKQTMGTQV